MRTFRATTGTVRTVFETLVSSYFVRGALYGNFQEKQRLSPPRSSMKHLTQLDTNTNVELWLWLLFRRQRLETFRRVYFDDVPPYLMLFFRGHRPRRSVPYRKVNAWG